MSEVIYIEKHASFSLQEGSLVSKDKPFTTAKFNNILFSFQFCLLGIRGWLSTPNLKMNCRILPTNRQIVYSNK